MESSKTKQARAQLCFHKPEIKAIVTTVGSRTLVFKEQAAEMGLSEKDADRLVKAIGLDKRQVVSGVQTTADLCAQSATRIFKALALNPESISALIFVSQSPDYSAPATAISLQHRLGLPITSMAFDMHLGCSGFIYGLSVAYSLVQSGLKRVLLCVGDVASRFVESTDHSIAPIMGDAGAAILIEAGQSDSFFELYSDGSGERALFMPNSGARKVPADAGMAPLMRMDGGAVFNFTLQRVPAMIDSILTFAGTTADAVDYFVMHQPNKYILTNIQKRLKLDDVKFPKSTQSVYGNQNSASIPGTISGFLYNQYSTSRIKSVCGGFGIGLSWGACVIETNQIYAPQIFLDEEKNEN
jgi:3-oxoacyl-[acyl-carrier-protein] synthase-3